MPTATYTRPQALVFQDYLAVPSEITAPLRAWLSGPNAQLHRYAVPAEKALINLGAYDSADAACYSWPGRSAGGLVDDDYVKLYVDNALLQYLDDPVGYDPTGGSGKNAPVNGRLNRVRSDSLAFQANGAAFPRSTLFFDRDVRVGDAVAISGLVDDVEYDLSTTVAGFAFETVAATIDATTADANNAANSSLAVDIEKTAGPENCVGATADATEYSGLVGGNVSETYTVTVTRSSINGDPATALLRVRSASGNDDADGVVPADFTDATAIGERGLTITFHDDVGSCSSAASADGASSDDLIEGQTWEIAVSQLYWAAKPTSAGTYAGAVDDIYIVSVSRGGVWDELPQISVTTARGLDYSGPTTVTGAAAAVNIGTKGVTISFSTVTDGHTLNGLNQGDKFYVECSAAANGRCSTLILRNNLPPQLAAVDDLNLNLYIQSNIQVAEDRISAPPEVNWSTNPTQICVEDGMLAYDPTWTNSGVAMPLPVMGGTLFVEYREWLTELTTSINGLNDVANIDQIPGQLDPDNPLKWGVYKAVSNSGGTIVRYTAVPDPTSLDDWQVALKMTLGNRGVYNLVPLTAMREVQELYQSQADSESSPDEGSWKGVFASLSATSATAIVSQASSHDGDVVLATLADDPDAVGTQYTLLTNASGNGRFITSGAQPGDIVRYLYTTDGFGNAAYTEFVVDAVLSEETLRLAAGYSAPVSMAQKIEIWHTLSTDELVTQIGTSAGAFGDRRVCAVWPDVYEDAGTTEPGYYLCAALAGLRSGAAPHQPLTNVTLSGVTGVSRTVQLFNADQLDTLASYGVWIVTQDDDGNIITRHALTTDMTDVNSQSESVRTNVDSISYLFLNRLATYIGSTNVTPTLLDLLTDEVTNTINYLKTSGATATLGSQLIDATVVQSPIQSPLAADRVLIVLSITVPAPTDNIELHLVI